MVKCISCHSSALELFPDEVSAQKKSSLQYHHTDKDDERPTGRNASERISDTLDRSSGDLYNCKCEEYRYSESCHRLSFTMTVGMVFICGFLCVPHSEKYEQRSDDIGRTLDRISDECIGVSEYTTSPLDSSEEDVGDDAEESDFLTVFCCRSF